MRAAAEPLSKIDKVTILSQGAGADVGIDRFMGEIAKVVAQAPAMVETLTGLSVKELLMNIPGLEGHVKQITGGRLAGEALPASEVKLAAEVRTADANPAAPAVPTVE